MIIGTVKENERGERRVAATPDSVRKLKKLGYDFVIESGAGAEANFPDSSYQSAGGEVVESAEAVFKQVDILIKVLPPTLEECNQLRPDTTLVSFVWPAQNEAVVAELVNRQVSCLALDCVPRISRAQKMDALSSMANIAGYRAVIEAANEFGSFFTGQITAAGKVPPAKVLVIGAGVAGLAAIGTANCLGAIVRAFDTRLAVKDQVKSMGAEFLELDFEESGEGQGGYAKVMSDEFIKAEMELFAEQCREVDMIITTALIPGRPAPKLITHEMVQSMKPGSVIVDLAAQNGGNCELTEPNAKVVRHGVTIIGYTDFPSRLPTQSSTLLGNNICNLLADMTPENKGELQFDLDDHVVRGSLVTHRGEKMWPPPKIEEPSPAAQPSVPAEPAVTAVETKTSVFGTWWFGFGSAAVAAILLLLLGRVAPPEFVSHLTVFVLACFVGWQVVWNVTPALHTPLMSVTNAISGIIIVGGMLQMVGWRSGSAVMATLLATVAVFIAMINVAGGFLVTQRMLGMFRKQD